jgi:hypothetical protein
MKSRSSVYSALSGGLLLIGVGLIFLLHLDFFPAILAVLGLSSVLAGLATGRGWYAIQSGLWLVGLALLFYFDIFWPGILILLGISALVGAVTRPMMGATPDGQQAEKPEK